MPVLQSLWICALFIAVFAGASEDPSRVAVKGTHLSLVPQKGFTESDNFTGFESQAHEASIMVVEIPVPSGPGALKEFEAGFTPAARAVADWCSNRRNEEPKVVCRGSC